MAKVFTVLFFIIVIAWAMGFRLHPENVPDYLPFSSRPKIFRKVDVKSGGSVVGILHRETEDKVVLRTEAGLIGFNKDEIVKMEALDAAEAESNRFWGVDQKSFGKPLLTYRSEDSLFYDKSKAQLEKEGTKSKEEDEEEEEEESKEDVLTNLLNMQGGDRMDLSSLRNNPMNTVNAYMQYQNQMEQQMEQVQGMHDMMGMMAGMASDGSSGGGYGDDDRSGGGFYTSPYNEES